MSIKVMLADDHVLIREGIRQLLEFDGSIEVISEVIEALEHNGYYRINVLCDPQLGKRGLYPEVSQLGCWDAVMSMTNFIAYADGSNDLIDISNIIGVSVKHLLDILDKLLQNNLLDTLPEKRKR